jgi:very-short-patch-repair endonuclease
MAVELTSASLDAAIAVLADAQHGVVARWQLVALGFSHHAIMTRIEKRHLRPIHRGVYAVGHHKLTHNGHAVAAVLACGPESFLSHGSAAALRDLRRAGQSRFDVTVPMTRRRRKPRIRVHVTRNLHPEDVGLVDDIPVATVPRIFVDLAAALSPQKLIYMAEQAYRLEVLDLRAIDRAIARAPNRRGLDKLRRALSAFRPPPFTRSGLERSVHAALRELDVPRYAVNQQVGDYDVDIWFPGSRLVIELDTTDYHGSPRKFEEDRREDIELQLIRCRVIRITGDRWRDERERVLWEIETFSSMPPPPAMPGWPAAGRRRSGQSGH